MIHEGLTFDDVLLVPQYSTVASRSTIDLSVTCGNLVFDHPIIPANMQTVTGEEMAEAVVRGGGLAILHRFMPLDEQFNIADTIVDLGHGSGCKHFAVSIGVKKDDLENMERFTDLGVQIFCIDIAHGDSQQCSDMIANIKARFPEVSIIAGNVATAFGARRLWEAGADIVKVGVGPGSLCTTRIETGNGVPQLTALMDVAEMRLALTMHGKDGKPTIDRPLSIIADGGIKSAGDCVKALCFADMVMAGNIFAGCQEAPGKTHIINGVCYKEYIGSSTHKTNHIEGVEAWVPCKSNYIDILTKLIEGIRSGCSYQGVHNLNELKDNPVFIRITNAALKESHPHDVILK